MGVSLDQIGRFIITFITIFSVIAITMFVGMMFSCIQRASELMERFEDLREDLRKLRERK